MMCRLIPLALSLLIGSQTIAQAQAAEPKDQTLNVGVHFVDITPPVGYPMAGYYRPRGAVGTLDPLYAKAIYLEQGDVAVAIVVCDLIGIADEITREVRSRVTNGPFAIPNTHVILAATHSHTAPSYNSDLRQTREGAGTRYVPRLIDAIVEAIETAADSARPVSLAYGLGHAEGVSFNRRFILEDGSIKTWGRYGRDPIVRPAGPQPSDVPSLFFLNDQSRPIASLSTFALHLDTVHGEQWSADFPADAARRLTAEYGPEFSFIFGAGTCGDINHVDPRSGETPTELIGERLANAVRKGFNSRTAQSPTLAIEHQVVALPLQDYTPDDLVWAAGVISADNAGRPGPMLDRVRAYKLRSLQWLREGRTGDEHARGVGQSKPPRLAALGNLLPVDVHAVRFSSTTAAVFLPGEVFVDHGLAIQRHSPFSNTLVIELASQNETSYLPTRLAYAGGGYETINSVTKPGSGERLVEAAVQLLKQLRSQNSPDAVAN